MSKIGLIIRREYFSRVKKKSFIIMTILGPLLLVGVMIVPIWLAMQKSEKQNIQVIDESYLFQGLLPEKDFVHFDYTDTKYEVAEENLYNTSYDAILYIPHNILEGGGSIKIVYKKQLSVAVEQYIVSTISKMMYDVILAKNKVDIKVIKNAEDLSRFKLITVKKEESGENKKTNTELYMGVGYATSILIYMFIFLYGVQVMRGVMEEKTNRIVEVILSSVKPFQLMMGKIIGVAMVGLTQFLIWVILSSVLYSAAAATLLKDIDIKQIQQKEEIIKVGADLDYVNMKKIDKPGKIVEIWNDFKSLNVVEIALCFLFYFLAGYLMYSALFAAIGAAVDNETETQQFMMPITVPLIIAFVAASSIMANPESPLAFWMSMIPLTSPVVMMVRLPFGVPAWELALSMTLLVLGFLFTTWLAAKIYRTGILMYGKKITWKELGKWLFYKG